MVKAPVSKTQQKVKRQQSRDSAKQRYEDLKDEIEKRQEQPKEAPKPGTWVIDQDIEGPVSETDKKKIISYRVQEKMLIPIYISELKNFFTEIGIPWIQAIDEGERLCCMLYFDNYVDAVFSTDTDTLVYGCDKVINSFRLETRGTDRFMPFYDFNGILTALGFTHEQFVDFCILCGTDFNDGIDKIGPVKAWDLIKEYKALNKLPNVYKKIPLTLETLNIEECKRIFNKTDCQRVIDQPKDIDAWTVNQEAWNSCSELLEKIFGKKYYSMAST